MRGTWAICLGLAGLILAATGAGPGYAENHDTEAGIEEVEDEAGSGELYQSGDYRLSRPGQRPVSNFYNLAGFQSVDPGCYAGGMTLETRTTHPAFPASVLTIFEQIRVRPRRTGGRFAQRHRWELFSDPFSIMGVTTIAGGEGGGQARVWLTVNLRYGIYRLVTDVRPRAGVYAIETTGPGVSNMAFEDLHFGFGDHHYSYVDLSGLQAAAGNPAVAAALADIDALLANRPPNVFMGLFDYIREAGADGAEYLRIEDTERIGLNYGVSVEGERRIELRIFCRNLVRAFGR